MIRAAGIVSNAKLCKGKKICVDRGTFLNHAVRMVYRKHEIRRHKPNPKKSRTFWRIYRDCNFKAVANLRRDAKRMIDFYVDRGVW